MTPVAGGLAVTTEPTRGAGEGSVRRVDYLRLIWVGIASYWAAYAAFQVWLRLAFVPMQQSVLIDARLYRLATLAWLNGGDPWGDLGMHTFGAPPPTLAFMLPFALVPEAVAMPAFAALSVAAIVYAVRRLGLPWYWCLWPPFVDAVIVGNPDAMLVTLLFVGAPLAVLAKAYAVLPLLGEGRWRALLLSTGLMVVTAPFLPWALYLERSSEIAVAFATQAQALSGWGTVLIVPAVIGLVLLGRKRAGWLAVPAAWPMTQFHYHAIALPAARSPLLALALSIPVAGVVPVAVLLQALWERRPAIPKDSGPVPEGMRG